MRAKFNKASYTIEKLNSRIDNKVEILGLIDFFWTYIKSNILELLKINWAILVAALYSEEYNYIAEI